VRALKIVERVYERIANRRMDFINQVSRGLVDRFSVVAFEDLNIKNILQNGNLAKSTLDVAWGMLVAATGSKAAYSGSEVILVNPRNTSQVCSGCETIVQKELADRAHSCPRCGIVMDRDLSAALNILRLGVQSLRQIYGSPGL